MKVIAFDPFLSAERAVELGVEKVELDELFRRADFITLHTPLTEKTRNIIDAAAIAKMKNGVRIINCARGGLVVEEALAAALEVGQGRRRRRRRLRDEPAEASPLFGARQRRLHAASRRLDHARRRRMSRCRSPSRWRTI